ncbi:MAG: S8 family serine peptidase, partial [Lachnospiraceae bacterium]|nr:S8 family serine peptidase [Lachnospiraceae bacterium]
GDLSRSRVRSMLRQGENAANVQALEVWNFDDEDLSIALVSSNEDPDVLAAQLEKRDDVKYAERNFKSHLLSVTDDTYSDLQWSMQPTEQAPNVQTGWAKGTGSDCVVAILDTGVDYRHPELKDQMWINPYTSKGLKGTYGYDFINGDADPMDEHGHGSHCAGIIGAAGNNQTGISGVNQKIKIMALRILDEEGSATLSHEIAAYHYINKALDLGVKVAAINNSWGGGESSRIFETLVEKVGKKGAITVCAAGNDGSEYADYPAGIDSPYLVSVAATKEDGGLVSFSNHGPWVDIAAPGTDILSTVCYDCYNPRLYGSRQAEISQRYDDFEHGLSDFVTREDFLKEIYINGEKLKKQEEPDQLVFRGKKGQTITVSVSGNGFLEGHCLSVSMNQIQEGDFVCLPLASYTVGQDETLPHLSVMTRSVYSKNAYGELFAVETGKETELTERGIAEGTTHDMYLDENGDYWGHTDLESGQSPEIGENRQFLLALSCGAEGEFRIDMDDIGLSRQDLKDTSAFEKYDFYSGTSMATPFITGAIALKRAQMDKENGAKTNPLDLVNDITSMTKAAPSLDIFEKKGSFDFRIPPKRAPRIAEVSLKTVNGKPYIELTGSGMDPKASDFSLKITKDGKDTVLKAGDVTGDAHKLSFADRGWKNNVVDLEIQSGGKTMHKDCVYLVKGKKTYAASSQMLLQGSYMATDGSRLFSFDQTTGCINYTELSEDPMNGSCEVPESLFGITKNKDQRYGFECGQMVYLNNCVYAIVDYGAVDQSEYGSNAIYDGKKLLIRADMDTCEAKAFAMPELGDLEGYALAAYNGKLYLLGGCTMKEENGVQTPKASTMVKVFDPAKGTWSDGKSLPSGRYYGRALQTGDTLVYTMGYCNDEESYAPNLLFDGKTWKESKAGRLEPNTGWMEPAVGITNTGLIYAGMPVKDLGDTFTYNVREDKFTDTGYNLITDLQEGPDFMVAAADYVFAGFTQLSPDGKTELYELPIQRGYVKIDREINGYGTVTGPLVNPPGNDVRLTFTADEGCFIESLLVDGKSIAVEKEAATFTYTLPHLMKDARVSVTFKDPWSEPEENPDDIVMGDNTLSVSGKKLTAAARKIGKKGLIIKRKKYLVTADPGQGNLTYQLAGVTKGKKKLKKKALTKLKKKLKVNRKSGTITLKKGLKKGTYQLRIKVSAQGDEYTYPITKTVKVTLKIK